MKRTPVRKRRPGKPRRGPWRSVKYRLWISFHTCICCLGGIFEPGCLNPYPVSQAAHTANNGQSSKGPDSACVPLCFYHHDKYDRSRRDFEQDYELDMKAIAAQYYAQYLKENAIND